MEIQVKKAIKAGNSSAVILPRAWLNKEVRIELVKKTSEMILSDTLEILKKYIALKSIIGIYLVGSHAREEEDENSDIDILVITDGIDKEMIEEGIYNILIVSYQLLHQKLIKNLFPVGQMIKEAKPLINEDYLNSIEVKVTKENIKWYLDTTEEKLGIIKEYIDGAKKSKNNKRYLKDKIAYTLILRIRTLEIIKRLMQNKDYSKKDFMRLINRISGSNNPYERYLASKNNLKEENRLKVEEAEQLYEYLEKDLERVRAMVKKQSA
ncbi:MAG: nucleotidyltransferase domain-containing protein [Candidatus Nanoarchaeia archaeon]|nr:nucleotidyltransferase domain-containing protein [Candidatus Nanoarchaeia archaeon]MDD5740552.1 nucleotidyltransferase domain-containing protein [Candidatus Nanoarchaeia archaeon]